MSKCCAGYFLVQPCNVIALDRCESSLLCALVLGDKRSNVLKPSSDKRKIAGQTKEEERKLIWKSLHSTVKAGGCGSLLWV